MSEIEGTIQFAYELTPPDADPLPGDDFAELSAWRSILHQLQLIGQTPDKYAGYGYGNLSTRSNVTENTEFVITASQTSGEQLLLGEHLVRVTHSNLQRFWVDAIGSEPPSSESLTHAMVYAADPRVQCVFHVHSTTIWQNRSTLRLPQTAVDVAYGSVDMIQAVGQLMSTHQSRPLVFATAGHEDGIFACGNNMRECGSLLVSYLARARALDEKQASPSAA